MFFIGASLIIIGSMVFDWFDYKKKKMPIVLKILFGLSFFVGLDLMVAWIFTM
jgi:hypothetical protein